MEEPMRGLRLLLVGTLAAALVPLGAGMAFADRPAGGFCDSVEGLQDDFESFNDEDIDFSDPDAIQEFYGQVADIYGELGSAAPKKLKKAFKTVQKYAEKLSEEDIDFSDPDSLDALTPSPKVTKAIAKIESFISDECGIDVTDTGDGDADL